MHNVRVCHPFLRSGSSGYPMKERFLNRICTKGLEFNPNWTALPAEPPVAPEGELNSITANCHNQASGSTNWPIVRVKTRNASVVADSGSMAATGMPASPP
jgi:hypothetical protein